MREESPEDLLFELYKFNQENRLDFYALVSVTLEHSQSPCVIISKPYWPVVDGNPGSEVFTIFPELICSECVGEEENRFKCRDIEEFIKHVIQCKKDVRSAQAKDDLNFYKKYKIVPKSVKIIIDAAREKRDEDAVCIAPVLDHPHIKGLADLQRKERERKLTDLANDFVQSRGPNGPIIRLAKGAEMPLDRMVWIQTPLSSELATLLLAGMQPIRHSSRGIHLPVFMRDTGVKKVMHLHVDRFEELAAVRMAEQNWETMQAELKQIGHRNTNDEPLVLYKPDVMRGESKDLFPKIIGRNLNFKRPNEPISEQKFKQNMLDDVNSHRRKIENMKRNEEIAMDLAHLADLERETATASKSNSVNKKVNGDFKPSHPLNESLNERPGCSKYI